jgi:CRISPR/Cas system-associated endoribonuclease Cas2
MGGRGETVAYTRKFDSQLSDDDREKLKEEINAIIDGATKSITIIALVEEPKPSR